MTINDIKEELMKKLRVYFTKTEAPKIYGEEVKKNMVLPCFFVYIVPVTTKNELYQQVKTLMVKITYFTDNDMDKNQEYYSMIDRLESIFKLNLKVKDRYFTLSNVDSIILDKFMQFTFTIDVQNATEQIEVTNIEGQIQTMLPDEESGYTQETVKLMNELEFKREV